MLASRQRADVEKTIKWLEAQGNPGVSYWTLRDIQGASENDPEARSHHSKISSFGPVRTLLDEQHIEGYWGEPEDCYWPKWSATVWPLILLAEMGMPGDHPKIRRACEYFLKTINGQDRSWPPRKYPDGDLTPYRLMWEPCVTGNMARTLVEFGYGDDSRVRDMFDWLVRYQLPDGGWNCEVGEWGKEVCHSSFMSTVEPLWAFSSLEPSMWPKGGREAVARACEFLLIHRLFKSDHTGKVIDEEWTRLHFPLFYFYDILHGLRVVTGLGFGHDERLSGALDMLLKKQLPDGTWPLEESFVNMPRWNFLKDPATGAWSEVRRPGTTIVPQIYESLGLIGQANPWTTLNALRIFKQLQ